MRLGDWAIAILVAIMLWMVICMGAAVAFAETGLDILGLARHDAKMIAEEIDNGTAIGVLDSTFGNPYSKIGLLAQTGKMSAYRVHLRDFTCYRSGRCPVGTPAQTDTAPISDGAKRLGEFQRRFPTIPCYVSPALEHDVKSRSVVEKWYAIIKRIVPNCRPVCSAFTGWCPSTGVLIERHGNKGAADIRSNDGDSLFDSNSVEFQKAGKVLSLGWIPEFNGRVSGEKVFVRPDARINWAGRALVRQAVRVMREPERRPDTACKQIRDPELFKTNAENYGKGKDDGRGNKGLFITSRRYDSLRVLRRDSSDVGYLKYYGPYSGGGFRHYIGTGSGYTPVDLMDKLRSEWGILKAGNSCWQFNAIRRLGSYR